MLKAEKAGFKISKCALCGAPIVWKRNIQGGNVPLDPKAPVFLADSTDGDAVQVKCSDDVGGISEQDRFMVSHFSTCVAKTKAWKLLEAFRNTDGVPGDLKRQIAEYMRQ